MALPRSVLSNSPGLAAVAQKKEEKISIKLCLISMRKSNEKTDLPERNYITDINEDISCKGNEPNFENRARPCQYWLSTRSCDQNLTIGAS